MKIVHVLHEFPFPPNSGVRCDMGRRLAAFHALGHQVFAISWASVGSGAMPSAQHYAELEALAAEVALLPINADFNARMRRVWNLLRHPSYVAARIPRQDVLDALMKRIEAFGPDLIWLEGVHPSWLAWEIKLRFGIPLAYRSHNIEHRYVAEQAKLALSVRLKLALTAGTWGLEKAERRLHSSADRVFDISVDDLNYWRSEGFERGEWLATQPDPDMLATAASPDEGRDIDLLFVGSLSSPNNVVGLQWFFDDVYPRILAALPDVRLVVAGRNPAAEVAARIAEANAVLMANPSSVADLFARTRVMINPILHGSGVNIKVIDMLASGRPVVTTSKGARGLPAEITSELAVADAPELFAAKVIEGLRIASKGEEMTDRGALIQRVLGIDAVAHALANLEKNVAS